MNNKAREEWWDDWVGDGVVINCPDCECRFYAPVVVGSTATAQCPKCCAELVAIVAAALYVVIGILCAIAGYDPDF